MTGPFRPLFGPFCTDILAERGSNAPEPCHKKRSAALFPKARFKVANKQVTDEVLTPADINPRLEVPCQSQSSGEEHSEVDKKAMSSPALSESGEEERSDPSMEGLVQDQGGLDKTETEFNLVAGFTDSLSNFLRANFQEPTSQEGETVKPIASGGDSMQALLAGMNESLPAFAANNLVVVPDSAPLDNVGPMDFTDAFPPLPMSQGDSMPTFRDFFNQQNSNPSGNANTGIADHRFYQPQAQKAKLVPRRAPVEAQCTTPCSEKRKADWNDAPTPGNREDSEEMETDGERGAQEASSDKGCEGRKSPRTFTRTEEQRMKDRAKAKRHRARKKVQEANDKSTICHLEAEVERLKKALKVSEDAQAESEKVSQTLEKEVELWKTAYRDLGRTMSDMLKVGGAGVAAKPTPS